VLSQVVLFPQLQASEHYREPETMMATRYLIQPALQVARLPNSEERLQMLGHAPLPAGQV